MKTLNASKEGLDRREFVRKVLLAAPAMGLACSLPKTGRGALDEYWICLVEKLGMGPDGEFVYLAVDCQDPDLKEFVYVQYSDSPLGSCENPEPPGCFDQSLFATFERENINGKTIVLDPNLPESIRNHYRRH